MTQIESAATESRVGKWKPYPAYKDSGVEWLGKIPVHWEVKRLKEHVDLINGYPFESALFSITDGIPLIRIRDLTAGTTETFYTGSQINNAMVFDNDVLIGMDGDFNVCWWQGGPALLNQRVSCLRSQGLVDLRFVYYLLHFPLKVINDLTWFTTVKHLSSAQIISIHYGYPPINEQRSIAAFLDRETARINALIAKKERLIKLLQEKRAALISHVVTKGLDSSVPTKESGIEWIERIPAHWEIKRVRDVTELLQTGPFGSQLHSSDYSSINGIPVINPSHLKDGRIYPDWDCTVDDEIRLRLVRHELHEGDIVFARRGEMGRCALVTEMESGWLCGTGSLLMRPRVTLTVPSFLNKVLSTNGVKDWLLLESVGSTMDNLNTSILSRIPLPIPPLPEQQAIIDFIDRETARLDVLISRIRDGIEKLKEYSTSLISAAVTGKIDVRGEISMQGSEI
jgi:type I restriction enzyme, S subunit